MLQAQLELIGASHNSRHPALEVFTDVANFVILQPWGHAIQHYHSNDCISGNDAMRFTAHHFIHN